MAEASQDHDCAYYDHKGAGYCPLCMMGPEYDREPTDAEIERQAQRDPRLRAELDDIERRFGKQYVDEGPF